MIFDYFDDVYILNLPRHKDRLKRVTTQLKGLVRKNRMRIFEAIDGNELPAPAYWGQGNGAFACLQSHVRMLHTIWQSKKERVLILEDDAILSKEAVGWLPAFFNAVPDDWGQMYLGGQHQQEPVAMTGFMVGKSINRTHAYAVQRKHIPQILQHILHAPDYIANSWKHIDHQLELAHQRGDWLTVCPEWWAFGQGENTSAINGRAHPDKWWDWGCDEMVRTLPWVIVTPKDKGRSFAAASKKLHFGWTLSSDGRTDVGVQSGMNRRTRGALVKATRSIAREAWDMRCLPAVNCLNDEQVKIFTDTVNPTLATLDEAAEFDLIKWAEALP